MGQLKQVEGRKKKLAKTNFQIFSPWMTGRFICRLDRMDGGFEKRGRSLGITLHCTFTRFHRLAFNEAISYTHKNPTTFPPVETSHMTLNSRKKITHCTAQHRITISRTQKETLARNQFLIMMHVIVSIKSHTHMRENIFRLENQQEERGEKNRHAKFSNRHTREHLCKHTPASEAETTLKKHGHGNLLDSRCSPLSGRLVFEALGRAFCPLHKPSTK